MTYEEWLEAYRPIKNHLSDTASLDGFMFETFGPELDFVRGRRNSTIWTWIEGDEGENVITNGYHHVNRIGYLVTEVPFTGDFLEIDLDDD